MAFKIDGRPMTVDQFRAHVLEMRLPMAPWKPSGIAIHNTGNPALYPIPGDDKLPPAKRHGYWKGSSIKPAQRVQNLAAYYSSLGWNAGPHLFIDDDFIWLFTPLTQRGVHSPSWNGTRWGIEMVGDYAIESFDKGPGAKVRDLAIAATAILCEARGFEPNGTTIRLHKEDTATNHDCPGKNVDKDKFIRGVTEYMGVGGDHNPAVEPAPRPAPVAPVAERAGVVTVSDLTLRELASASSSSKGSLPKETVVAVLEEAMNGATKWFRIRTPGGFLGWVAARYVELRGAKKPKVNRAFIVNGMAGYGWSRVAGYGFAANSYQESSFDPDAVGDGGKAYGLFQWHGDRQAQFKQVFGKPIQDATAEEQLAFLDWELRNTERRAGEAMKAVKTAYEAGSQFSRLFERPKLVEVEADRRGRRAQEWFDADGKA